MSVYRSPFSYYGAKSKIAHLYPAPLRDTIMEPFAGAACYSFRYWERNVILNDVDPITYAIWRFLTSPAASDVVERFVPDTVTSGDKISEMVPVADVGLVALLRAAANQGTQGTRSIRDVVTPMAAGCWNGRLKRKLMDVVIPRVRHWTVTNTDYAMLPDRTATWYIDPPYANAAGRVYRHAEIDYGALAKWAQSCTGQVIVCENIGAAWLPFEPLGTSARGIKSRYQRADAGEALYHVAENLPASLSDARCTA